MADQVDRAKVWRGGLASLAVGVFLLALVVFFLLAPLEEPSQVVGVFVPLAVALIALGLAVAALVPLWWGDSNLHSPRVIARALAGLAVLGVVLTVLGVVRGDLPWDLFAVLPLASVGALLKDVSRLRRAAV